MPKLLTNRANDAMPNAAAIIAIMLVAAIVVFGSSQASAHDWYPIECCGGDSHYGDCRPLLPSEVRALGGGAYVVGGAIVLKGEVRRSPDASFHGCFRSSGLRCFFAPAGPTS
jgi:hypothetical protein